MKAKVKSTGEIVTLLNMYADGTARDTNGHHYHQGDISEYIEESYQSPIDWEQRRYEIARDVMVASFNQPMSGASVASHVHNCVLWADDLIKELKKESK